MRLQHIAEEELGTRIRQAHASEDAAAADLARKVNG